MISALGPLPFFEKARWLDVIPEYNPFKYNSFPANAANQSYRVSSLLRAEVADASRSGLLDRLPPILAFQSVVDCGDDEIVWPMNPARVTIVEPSGSVSRRTLTSIRRRPFTCVWDTFVTQCHLRPA